MIFNNALLFMVLFAACAGYSATGANGKTEPLVTGNGIPFEAPDYYPAFSWEKVPVYMMFGCGERLLQDSEVRKIAGETGFICIEKDHGLRPLGDAVLGLEHESRAFKKQKPGIVVLGYLNSALTYPFTRYTKMFTPEKVDGHPDMKAFLVTDPNQMHGFSWMHPGEQRQAVADGVADMMAQLKAKIGPDKIFLANNAAHIDKVFEVADAFMFEHYNRKATHTKEKLLQDWQLMEKIADAGKICIYRFGPEPGPDSPLADFSDGKSRVHTKHDEYAALSKEQLEFYLALYLIGAQPYSYFQWNWGWGLETGPLEHYPEFHKPLGKPLGKYRRVHPDQWEFTREFEHAGVWVDTGKWKARIEWK
jgi:hypothetical protein